MLANVTRDVEVHPLTLEMFLLRAGEKLAAAYATLAEGLGDGRRSAVAGLALDFRTWRSLHRGGLARVEAVEAMVAVVLAP